VGYRIAFSSFRCALRQCTTHATVEETQKEVVSKKSVIRQYLVSAKPLSRQGLSVLWAAIKGIEFVHFLGNAV